MNKPDSEEERSAIEQQLVAVSDSLDASIAQILGAIQALGLPDDLLKRMAPPKFWDQLHQYKK